MKYSEALFAYEAGDKKKAKQIVLKYIEKNKKDSAGWNLLGVLLNEEGHYDSAINAYKNSISSNNKNAQTYCNLGSLYQMQGRLDEAKNAYKKALDLDPNMYEALFNFAVLLKQQREHGEAREFFEQALLKISGNGANLRNGQIYQELNDHEKAIEEFTTSIELGEFVSESLMNIGLIKKEQKLYGEAREFYLKSLEYNPSNFMTLNNLGVLEQLERRYYESLENFAKAIAIRPNYDDAYANLGETLFRLREYDRAKAAILKSLEINPKNIYALLNLGVFVRRIGNIDGAIDAFNQILKIDQNFKLARINMGLLLMSLDDYERGLELYEARPKPTLATDRSVWNGEDITNATLLVYHEQGFGDTINFARLLPMAKQKCKELFFMPQKPLFELFKTSTLDINIVSQEDVEAQKIGFDHHISLISLLRVLKIRPPHFVENLPYICVDENKKSYFDSKIPNNRLKIGIVWQGNPDYAGDTSRSCELGSFKDFVQNGTLVSLQKDIDKDDLKNFDGEILDFSDEIKDFSDTAAIIECLDLIISVDTSVAHLAGTMNKKTILLLPYMPDWRWGYSGTHTAWYSSVSIFRQSSLDNWDSVFEDVKKYLSEDS